MAEVAANEAPPTPSANSSDPSLPVDDMSDHRQQYSSYQTSFPSPSFPSSRPSPRPHRSPHPPSPTSTPSPPPQHQTFPLPPNPPNDNDSLPPSAPLFPSPPPQSSPRSRSPTPPQGRHTPASPPPSPDLPDLESAAPPPPPPFNVVASFADMSLAPHPPPYPPALQLMPMHPHAPPPVPMSPQHHAAHVAHHQRRHLHPHHAPQQFQLWVPKERVGAVIGGQGAVIRSLQDRSGAAIKVHNNMVQGDLKLFTIVGTVAQYEAAAHLVKEIVDRPRPFAHAASPASSERSHFSVPFPPEHAQRTTELYKTVYVPTSFVGLVIGRNGDTIRSLQDKSGADIKVTPDEEAPVGSDERSIQISGTDEAISTAHQLLSEIVMDARSRRPPSSALPVGSTVNGHPVLVEVLAVPNEKVGLIIGKHGTTIRDLQAKSGAKIQVTKDESYVQSDGSRPVTITGVRTSVDDAKAMIASKINLPILSSGPATAPFAGPPSVSSVLPIPTPPPVRYAFSPVYEGDYPNPAAPFPPVFDPNDANSQNRANVAYFQYVGYNNYPALTQHHRQYQQVMPYPPPHQGPPEQTMHSPHSDQHQEQDPHAPHTAQPPYSPPGPPQPRIDDVPTSPALIPRDPNGNPILYPSHAVQQISHQLPTRPMYPPPNPNSRVFLHPDHAQAVQVHAAHMYAHHAQAHAHAQAAQIQAHAHAHAQAHVQAQNEPDADAHIQPDDAAAAAAAVASAPVPTMPSAPADDEKLHA